jgi:two-component system chemotaxis response regulator CheB
VIAIGASTGGPGALVTVLSGLPPDLAVPVVIVLHIGELFASSFGAWLESQTARRVVHAEDGQVLRSLAGRVVLAPPGRHLAVRYGQLRLEATPERHACRPSIDVLFESLADDRPAEVVACLLTGMGRDGAAGLLALRNRGAFTIAQDEATSLVYGMPREAAQLGAARRVLPIGEIGAAIGALTAKPAGADR